MVEAKVIHGDCVEEMAKLPAGSVDLVITSPPYNVGKEYGEAVDDDLPYEEYLDWLDTVWAACWRILVGGGRLCINVADLWRNPYVCLHGDIAARLARAGWHNKGIIIWDKGSMSNGTAWGSWMSASNPGLRGVHEFIIVAAKGTEGKPPRLEDAISGPYTREEFMDLTREVWRMQPETKNTKHPAPFPLELPSRLIRLYSFVGDVVVDPFCGSGTTLRAALDFGRDAIGFDLVEEYAEMSQRRVSQAPMFSGEV